MNVDSTSLFYEQEDPAVDYDDNCGQWSALRRWIQRSNPRPLDKHVRYDTIRYEKSFVSAPLQINIHYESAAQLAVKNVPERNIYR